MTNTQMTKEQASMLPAASLAYLGDAVLEIFVREELVRSGVKNPSIESLKYVTAPNQSAALEKILPHLSEDEEAEFRRGRNCVHSGVPKSSTPAQYRRATGLEVLFAYLYLTGNESRARELFRLGYGGETP